MIVSSTRDQVVVAARVEGEDHAVDGPGGRGRRDADAEADRRDPIGRSTPSSAAEIGFCTVARTARPNLVRQSITDSDPRITTEMANANTRTCETW